MRSGVMPNTGSPRSRYHTSLPQSGGITSRHRSTSSILGSITICAARRSITSLTNCLSRTLVLPVPCTPAASTPYLRSSGWMKPIAFSARISPTGVYSSVRRRHVTHPSRPARTAARSRTPASHPASAGVARGQLPASGARHLRWRRNPRPGQPAHRNALHPRGGQLEQVGDLSAGHDVSPRERRQPRRVRGRKAPPIHALPDRHVAAVQMVLAASGHHARGDAVGGLEVTRRYLEL